MWSKLKKHVESMFAPSVAKRISLFLTGYSDTHNEVSRWAIRVDGDELIGIGGIAAAGREWELIDQGISQREAWKVLRSERNHTAYLFCEALHEYTVLSIDECLNSEDALIRSLAMFDRRLGKRRLRKMLEQEEIHPAITKCLFIRCSAEGITKTDVN